MKLSMASILKLVPIEIRRDKKNYIVEDQVSGEFYEMTEVCIDAIKMIQDGLRLDEIEPRLKQKYPREEVDILDFAEQLLDLELIDEIDGIKGESKQKSRRQLGFQWISPRVGKFFFNKYTAIIYFVLFIGNLALFIIQPALFPRFQDMFVSRMMVLNIPIWMVLTFIFIIIHEFGHVLAIRSHNLPTKLEVGHRLFLIVLETDMSSVWKLSSKDRNKLYIAGLCFDTVILFLALAGQLLLQNGNGIFPAVLRLIVLDTFIRMIYQLCIFIKTDLYFVLENSSGCYNLMENAQELLRKRLGMQQKMPGVSDVVFESERKTILLYSILYFAGVAVSLAVYIFFYLPQLFYALKKVLPGFEKPMISISFWDSAMFVLELLIGILLLGYSWIKKYRQET